MGVAARNRSGRSFTYPAGGLTRRGLLGGLTGASAIAASALLEADRAFAASRAQLKFDGFQNVLDLVDDDIDRNDPSFDWQQVINNYLADPLGQYPPATLYFPPRTYMLGAPIYVTSNSRLVGNGPLSILKAKPGSVTYEPNPDPEGDPIRVESGHAGPIINAGGSVIDSHIVGLTLDGNRAERITVDKQLLIVSGERIHVRRVNCVNGPHSGMTGGTGPAGLFHSSICDCRILRCPKDGITIWGTSADLQHLVLARNLIKDCRDDHLGLLGGPTGVAIVGNVIDYGPDMDDVIGYNPSNGQGAQGSSIMVRFGANNVTIAGNVVRGGARAGIELRPGPTVPAEDVTITHNVIVESGNVRTQPAVGAGVPPVGEGTGIFLNGAGGDIKRVSISGNVISAPRNHGIWMLCTAARAIEDITVTGNVIRYNRDPDPDYFHSMLNGNGILCSDVSDTSRIENICIAGNTIVDTRRPGIEIKGRSKPPPASAADRTVRRIDVQGNQIVNPGPLPGPLGTTEQSAVRLEGVERSSVGGNRAHYPSSPAVSGLQLQNVSKDVVVEGNTVASGGSAPPVSISSSSDVQRLRIRDNPGFNPWTGERDIDGSGTDRNLRVPGPTGSLPVPFPTAGGVPKVKILATPVGDLEAYVTVHSVQADNFTLRVVLPGAVPAGSKISWIAEPFDD